jgi:hypothetical protein
MHYLVGLNALNAVGLYLAFVYLVSYSSRHIPLHSPVACGTIS